MRIISGIWKGKSLHVPREGTRPSTDRTRQGLFNLLQNVIEGARVLDLYAGSGALALEALSRGAVQAVAVESDRAACRMIRKNAESLGCDDLEVANREVRDYLARQRVSAPFSLILADPPYEKTFLKSELHHLLTDENLLRLSVAETHLVMESPKKLTPEELAEGSDSWKVVVQRNYGKSHLTVFERI